jgi:hypothetical protein
MHEEPILESSAAQLIQVRETLIYSEFPLCMDAPPFSMAASH